MSPQTRLLLHFKYTRVSIVRQSFEHDVDSSANRSGKKLAQLEPTWLAYSIGYIRARGGVNSAVNTIDLVYI